MTELHHPWLTRFFYTAHERDLFIVNRLAGKFHTYPTFSPYAHRKYKLEFQLLPEYHAEYSTEHHPVEKELIERFEKRGY